MRTIRKDSDDIIREGIDWSDQLVSGETILSSSWTVGQGLTGGLAAYGSTYSDIDLSGGTVGSTYKVTNSITTSEGLSYTKSFKVQVVNK